MAGGKFTTQNKVRPGVYINMETEGQAVGTLGERGTVALALQLSWGPSHTMLTINSGDNVRNLLGYDMTASQLLLVREALKRARTLLLYRLNAGTQATATHGTMTATAKYGGVRGNDIDIVVQENVDNAALFDVITYFADEEVDVQTVADTDSLEDNDWVVFSGTGVLTTTAGVPLTGGADGSVTNENHTNFLEAAELEIFNAIGYVGVDSTLKSLYEAFVKRLRDEEGRKIQSVLENHPTADFEGVISVKNGVVLSDQTVLTAAQAVAWVAGATAAAGPDESLTYTAYDGAVDVSPRYSNSQIIAALENGEFVFTINNGRAVVEQDINTFKTFTSTKGKAFRKNRTLRVLDGLATDWHRIFEMYYIGRSDNNADGRALFRKECVKLVDTYQSIGAVQNFDAQADIEVAQGDEADAVVVSGYVQPVDSIEKVYMKVRVR